MNAGQKTDTGDGLYKWGIRIPVVIMSVFLFVASQNTIERFGFWLSWCFLTILTTWVALLILSIFSEWRDVTFAAMMVVSIIAGFVLLFLFGILLKSEMPVMGPLIGLIPPHIAWMFFGPLMAIVKDWTLDVGLVIWLIMMVTSFLLGKRFADH